MKKLTEKILAVLANDQTVSLATISSDGKPWVRYVTLFAKADFPLLFCTDIGSRKIAHIRNNPEVHITCGNLAPPRRFGVSADRGQGYCQHRSENQKILLA
jgi:general stress protein 26